MPSPDQRPNTPDNGILATFAAQCPRLRPGPFRPLETPLDTLPLKLGKLSAWASKADVQPPHEPDKIAALQAIVELIKSGFAGILPTGLIVDRRTHPDAIPIAENALLGTPPPKPV